MHNKLNADQISEFYHDHFVSDQVQHFRLVLMALPRLGGVSWCRANTFGMRLRFRAHEEWKRIFVSEGFEVERCEVGASERVSMQLRILLIKTIRRDSFLLRPRS